MPYIGDRLVHDPDLTERHRNPCVVMMLWHY